MDVYFHEYKCKLERETNKTKKGKFFLSVFEINSI